MHWISYRSIWEELRWEQHLIQGPGRD